MSNNFDSFKEASIAANPFADDEEEKEQEQKPLDRHTVGGPKLRSRSNSNSSTSPSIPRRHPESSREGDKDGSILRRHRNSLTDGEYTGSQQDIGITHQRANLPAKSSMKPSSEHSSRQELTRRPSKSARFSPDTVNHDTNSHKPMHKAVVATREIDEEYKNKEKEGKIENTQNASESHNSDQPSKRLETQKSDLNDEDDDDDDQDDCKQELALAPKPVELKNDVENPKQADSSKSKASLWSMPYDNSQNKSTLQSMASVVHSIAHSTNSSNDDRESGIDQKLLRLYELFLVWLHDTKAYKKFIAFTHAAFNRITFWGLASLVSTTGLILTCELIFNHTLPHIWAYNFRKSKSNFSSYRARSACL